MSVVIEFLENCLGLDYWRVWKSKRELQLNIDWHRQTHADRLNIKDDDHLESDDERDGMHRVKMHLD